jgi:hypothetical protein
MMRTNDNAKPLQHCCGRVHAELDRQIRERLMLLDLILLDLAPGLPRRKRVRRDALLGLALCLPLYGYDIYKMLAG